MKESDVILKKNLSKFLHPDQLDMLKLTSDNTDNQILWSNDTIQRCLAIRSVVGRNGYEYLRKLNYPMPSYRTLCRRIQKAPFAPGIQHDVLGWLKMKMEGKTDCEKLCVLLVDEMQLRTRIEYDTGLQQFVGYVSPETIPTGTAEIAEKDLASHALVFMLRGLTSSWKQTVGYLFTGASLKKEPYWEFTKKVIEACEQSGFKVQCITSDMGPVNTGLWRHVGNSSTRNQVITSISHPYEQNRSLYFVADPPHLLKNLWNCVLTNKISIKPEIVQKHGLPTDVVNGVATGT